MTEKKVSVRMVHIRRGYGENDKFECTVELAANSGKIELKLPEDRVNQIVDLVADMVIAGTTEAMQQMTRDAMAHNLLEHEDADEA